MKIFSNIFFLYFLLIELGVSQLQYPEDGSVLHYTHIMFQWVQEPDVSMYSLIVTDQNQNTLLNIETDETIYIDKNSFTWENTYNVILRSIDDDQLYNDSISFSVGQKFESADLETNILNDEFVQDGLILFSQVSPDFRMVIIDKFGNQIWNSESVYINHWNEYGQLFGMQNGRGVETNFINDILWMTPLGTEIDAHEIKQISNGNYMGIVPEYELGPIPIGPWTGSYQNLGYEADGVTNEFTWRATNIIEWDGNTNEEIWNWRAFEHYDMNDYDSLEGRWWSPLNGSSYGMAYDWNHVNSFDFDLSNGMVYVSSRNLSRITKVSYPSYDLVWNIGPSSNFGYGDENICTDLLFSCQHHIQRLDNGDLLFFDNGKLSEIFLNDTYPTTRIRRIRVIDDSYCENIWEYELPEELYGHSWGSVQLLDNGNYFLYTHGSGHQDGSICTMLEVTSDKELVWQASHTIPFAVWYRSYKIPSIHPQAFSINLDRYHYVEMDTSAASGIIFDDNNQSLIFTIKNHSGYSQPYTYQLNDYNGVAISIIDTVYVEAGEEIPINIVSDIFFENNNNIELIVKPLYHKWKLFHKIFKTFFIPGILGNSKEVSESSFSVNQNYPNPFNPITTLSYNLPQPSSVDLTIYDIMGNVVFNQKKVKQTAGYHSVRWDATNINNELVSTGVYLYKIQAGDFIVRKKMIFLK